eukprot:255753_1
MSHRICQKDATFKKANCCKKMWIVLKDMKDRREIYLPISVHLSDTATDYATVIEFGIIAFAETCTDINTWAIFGLSLSAMMVYRIISSFIIYRITHSLKRTLCQFFDLEVFYMVYIGHFMELTSKSSPQRLIASLEAVFEAAPQAVIQTIYLLKTGDGSWIIYVSSALSFINLTLNVIGDDKNFLEIEWKTFNYFRRTELSIAPFIFLYFFRICDVPSKILSYILFWYLASGVACSIYVA